RCGDHRPLPSFPTRRSSDLGSIWNDSPLGFLVVGIAGVIYVLHRSHTRLSERHKSLETLHDFTRGLGGSLELAELERAVVEGIRDRKSTRLNSSHVKISYAV